MKRLFIIIVATIMASSSFSQNAEVEKTALIIVDVQDFYFPGGKSELVNPQAAADKTALILKYFREKGMPVVHVKHESKTQSDIQKTVTPIEGEKVITKKEVSSFNGTDLNEYLKSLGVKNLVICGMQTHMCVEGAVRAGYDLGYKITLIHDACATKDLKFGDEIVPAKMVHLSTLSTLKAYAKVVSVEEFINGK